jgi:hypothetical protein
MHIRLWFGAKPTLLTKFTIFSGVLLSAIAIALMWILQHQIEKNALLLLADHAAAQAASLVNSSLSIDDFAGSFSPARYEQIDALIRNEILSQSRFVRVKIWNSEGVVVYSDQRDLVGSRFPNTDEREKALAGEITSDVSSLGQEDNLFERGRFRRLLEVYVPIQPRGAARVLGVYEVYEDLAVTDLRLGVMRRTVAISCGIGFLFMYGMLIVLLRSASRKLVQHDREIARLYGEATGQLLERKKAEEVLQINYQIQTVLSALLRISLLDITLEKQLQKILDHIISLPWISLQSRGCIFLVETDPRVLVMRAQTAHAHYVFKSSLQYLHLREKRGIEQDRIRRSCRRKPRTHPRK